MSKSEDTAGPVILWTNLGCEGWSPRSYPDVKSALEGERYTTDFLLTRVIQYEVVELQPPLPTK